MEPKKIRDLGNVRLQQLTLCPGNGTQYELFFVGPLSGPISAGSFGAFSEAMKFYIVACNIGTRTALFAKEGALALDYVKEKLGLKCDEDGEHVTKGIGEFIGRPYQKKDGSWSR